MHHVVTLLMVAPLTWSVLVSVCCCLQDDLMDAAEVKDMLDVAGHVKVRWC